MSSSNINSRKTGVGKPSAIMTFGTRISKRQERLLKTLLKYGDFVEVNKKDASVRDLSSLTAYTGVEFAMFTKENKRLICRGDETKCDINIDKAKQLDSEGYRWSGHTHVGIDNISLIASGGDIKILNCFAQEASVIYNSNGRYNVFYKE